MKIVMKTYKNNFKACYDIFLKGDRKMNKQQRVRFEMEKLKMANYIASERQDIFIQCILIMMYTLRNDYSFGQKRVIEFIEKFLSNMTDFKLGTYYTRPMLIETLETELKINIDQFIRNEVAKTYECFQTGI